MTTRAVFPAPGESRLTYLARVLVAYIAEADGPTDGLIHYDGADCDGQCLAEDIQSAVEQLPDLAELKKAVAFYDSYLNTPDQVPPGPTDDSTLYLIKVCRKLAR